MRKLAKYIISNTYKPLLVKYLATTRTYTYKGLCLAIPPEVFHPGFFYSTKLLLRYLKHKQLHQKTFLELGAGSGLISMHVVKKGAVVTATDINPVAIEYLHKNAKFNRLIFSIVKSDLFDALPESKFDFIIINPPYYKKDPVSELDYAWYCGENGEYFEKLFKDLRRYVHDQTEVYMVLCDGCDLEMVKQFAKDNSFALETVYRKATMVETNFIFKVELCQAYSNQVN